MITNKINSVAVDRGTVWRVKGGSSSEPPGEFTEAAGARGLAWLEGTQHSKVEASGACLARSEEARLLGVMGSLAQEGASSRPSLHWPLG